jgi:acetyl-CoA carboxylase carboxyl transferase alpha subunit
VPFLSILSDPTTGGVFASFAAVGDVNIAEPDALIGFAGARVTAGTIAAELPPGFQRSEFLFSHGFVDRVVTRPELRGELTLLLRLLPPRGVSAPIVDVDDGLPAFRPLSFLSSIADRVGELATGDGAGASPGTAVPTLDGAQPAGVPGTGGNSGVESVPAADIQLPPASTEDVWARVQLARNLRRPHTLEFIAAMADDFVELHGDRLFGDDEAVVAGLARIAGRRVAVIGQQKGADTDENIRRNFGMPHPEGYRKAMRVMELAERTGLPVVTFVDVPGAHPGPESEERGIAEAIARSIGLMSRLRTPIVAVITGEGGSGGALAIAVGDVVIALENAVYSVISPEGCASILWRTPDEAATAAAAMRMSAADQHALGVVDIVVAEPGEGAHAQPQETAKRLRSIIVDRLDALSELPTEELLESRYRRYRALGAYTEAAQPQVTERVDRGLADRLRDLLDPARRGMAPVTDAWSRDDPPAREEV